MRDECFMLSETLDGGGNVLMQNPITVKRTAAIGDSIAASIVADKLIEQGFPVIWQTHGSIHPVMKRHPRLSKVISPGGFCDINLDGAYEKHPQKRSRHFYELFMATANAQLARMGINLGEAKNCRPRLIPNKLGKEIARKHLEKYPKPWVMICPRSDTYMPRQIPDGVWTAAAPKINGTCFWLGRHPAAANTVDLKVSQISHVMDWLSVADLLITVDTGPMHIGNALGVPVLAILQSSSPELHLSDQTDFLMISPLKLDCLNCMENVCPKNEWVPPCTAVDPEAISTWANNRLRATQSEDVSAVIPIFKPREEMLNRCLDAVLPQVNEVVITMERGGILPRGTIDRYGIRQMQVRQTSPLEKSEVLQRVPQQKREKISEDSSLCGQADALSVLHPENYSNKICCVVKQADRIGFGRNVNFGVRHSRGKYVVVLNDDVFLDRHAVARMMDVMKPGVGIVGMLTYYPDGTIYHAGKARQLGGGIGFPHLDLRKREPTIKEPLEMENTNGASILFRREAFFQIGGYDEQVFMYCEDDLICMSVRAAGWKLWYTPHAFGIHETSQESCKVAGIHEIMSQSNRRFGQLWSEYFRHNAKNPGIGNFDYLKNEPMLAIK